MLTSICLKKVLSPFSVFGVVGIRHQVGVLIGSQGTIDGEVQGVLTHDLLTQAVVHVSQPTIVGFLIDHSQVRQVHIELLEHDLR